jgi:hypothetical protein
MYARDSGSMSVVVGERGVNVCFRTSTKLKETISQRLVHSRMWLEPARVDEGTPGVAGLAAAVIADSLQCGQF